MPLQRIAISALFAAGLAALPLSSSNAQPYSPLCNPFPLTWPFCVVGAVVGTAGAIVTAPFRAVAGPSYSSPYYGYYPYYGAPPAPYYYPPSGAYYPQGAYGAPYASYGPR